MSIIRAVHVFLHQLLGPFVADHDSDVSPWCGAPVGIVIALLRDFQSPPCPCCVLPSVNRQITFKFLVSSKQTCDIEKTRTKRVTKWFRIKAKLSVHYIHLLIADPPCVCARSINDPSLTGCTRRLWTCGTTFLGKCTAFTSLRSPTLCKRGMRK